MSAFRRAIWFASVTWALGWFTLYLEIYRYRHVILGRMLDVFRPTTSDAAARPGVFVRAVVLCSILAPVVVVALWGWDRGHRTPGHIVARRDPPFPVATSAVIVGLAFCVLAGINHRLHSGERS